MKKRIVISSVLGGRSPMYHVGKPGQFLHSIGIDPERNVNAFLRPSGSIMPTRYQKKSSSGLTGAPMFFIQNPKSTTIFVYCSDGVLLSYDALFTSETVIGTPTNGAGNGAAYYNNYAYLSTPTDISRYGALDGSKSIANTYWSSTLGKTALTNTTYPSTRNVSYPNHPLFPHPSDGRLYIGDYKGGQGMIHSLITAADGSGGSGAYAAAGVAGTLMLPFGMMPMAMGIGANGTDLAILCTPEGSWSSGAIFKPGNATLFLWDRSSASFYRQVTLREAMGSALLNKNGQLFVFTGNIDRGVTLSRYLGGYSCSILATTGDGSPPFQGAVDSTGDQIVWGATETLPLALAGVLAYGFRSQGLPATSINHIGRISNTADTLPIVTALKSVLPGTSENQLAMGWRTTSTANYGIDSEGGTGTYTSFWRSDVFNIGQRFTVDRIKLPLTQIVAANMTITPKLVFDDNVNTGVTSVTLKAINSTNYPNGELLIDPTVMASDKCNGNNSFYLELGFSGTVELGVMLPITIDISTLND